MTLTIRLDNTISARLEHLAKLTHRSKSFYVKKVLLENLDDLEDTYIAEHRLENPEKTVSLKDVVKNEKMER
jgi:RHH-type rel operon transcriptional repressor/antitoxin RelB